MTPAQTSALKWLRDRGGDGCFDKRGIALAQGETAPVMRSTWNALRDAGEIEFYGGAQDGGRGYGRLRVVQKPAALGFDEDHSVERPGRVGSVKRSHRAEGRNWID